MCFHLKNSMTFCSQCSSGTWISKIRSTKGVNGPRYSASGDALRSVLGPVMDVKYRPYRTSLDAVWRRRLPERRWTSLDAVWRRLTLSTRLPARLSEGAPLSPRYRGSSSSSSSSSEGLVFGERWSRARRSVWGDRDAGAGWETEKRRESRGAEFELHLSEFELQTRAAALTVSANHYGHICVQVVCDIIRGQGSAYSCPWSRQRRENDYSLYPFRTPWLWWTWTCVLG